MMGTCVVSHSPWNGEMRNVICMVLFKFNGWKFEIEVESSLDKPPYNIATCTVLCLMM